MYQLLPLPVNFPRWDFNIYIYIYMCIHSEHVSTHFSKGILMNRYLRDCGLRLGGWSKGKGKGGSNRHGPVQIRICHLLIETRTERHKSKSQVIQKTKTESASQGIGHTCDKLPSCLFLLFGNRKPWRKAVNFCATCEKVKVLDDYLEFFNEE